MGALTTLSESARLAAGDPAIAAVLLVSEAAMEATLACDVAGFLATMAPECMVNNPANMAVPGAGAGKLMEMGLIHYSGFERAIDYLGHLPGGMVVVMGEEIVVPDGKAHDAGRTVRRRFTDVWRDVGGGDWKLSVRQATILSIV